MTPGPRARLIAATIAMIQEQGVHAAGLAELLKRSNASRNSLYQHFPAGKSELVQAAARIVSRIVCSHINQTADLLATSGSVEKWLDELIRFWRAPLATSSYREGSFMMAAALDESDTELQAIAGQAFSDWAQSIAATLAAAGLPADRAASVGRFMVTAIEGAIVQSRALKSVRPLDDARDHLLTLVQSQLAH
jgi:AcrR family transcriptional regulator